MLMEAVRWLRESGLTVEDAAAVRGDSSADAILDVAAGDRQARFAVQSRSRAPYPHELERLQRSRRELAHSGQPLLVVPFVPESLGPALADAGWSWADSYGNFDLSAPGLLLRQRRVQTAPTPKRKSLPRGSGSFAVIRTLVRFGGDKDEEFGATALAAQVDISQPRVSQILHRLDDLELVDRSGHGRWKPRREALMDRFLAEYPGPGGGEQYFYTLDDLIDVAVRAGRLGMPNRPIVASADVGPDLIVSWRRPGLLILYVKHSVDPAVLKLTPAQGPHDANVVMRMPDDESVFPSPPLTASVKDSDVPLADPLQQIWDLENLGGADRVETAGKVRQWLLTRP
jgi:hypothetical protein